MTQRPWKHFEKRNRGKCEIEINGQSASTSYVMGLVETGRQRVYAGYEVRIANPAGGYWIGHDQWSPPEALRMAQAHAEADGVRLMCAGLSLFWFETGLSAGSGYGYFPWSREPVFMMDEPTPPGGDGPQSSTNLAEAVS